MTNVLLLLDIGLSPICIFDLGGGNMLWIEPLGKGVELLIEGSDEVVVVAAGLIVVVCETVPGVVGDNCGVLVLLEV